MDNELSFWELQWDEMVKELTSQTEDDSMEKRKPKCLADNCSRQAFFNYRGTKEGVYCSKHKLPKMVNFKLLCSAENCYVRPTYNFKGERPKFCAKHKVPGMIDPYRKFCIFDGCEKTASFNFEEERRPIYCLLHSYPSMVNIKNRKTLRKDSTETKSN